jgi:ABC-2 type transport system ATP-binding protein
MILETHDLWKRFGRHVALKGVNLKVPEGSAYALIGANGAGKSTLIKILANLMTASRGESRILGVATERLGKSELAEIGYVSENQRMPSRLTVREYLDYLRPFYRAWNVVLERQTLERFQLPQDRKIGALSYGMHMKLALTCALVFRPRLLIMDEPFSGIDPVVRDELMAALLEQAGETSVFVSSHDLDEIEGLISHIAFLQDGTLLFENSIDQLNARFRGVRIVFDGPATRPSAPPSSWLDLRCDANVLSFVEKEYSDSSLTHRLDALPGAIRHVEIAPQRLRPIVAALIRNHVTRVN